MRILFALVAFLVVQGCSSNGEREGADVSSGTPVVAVSNYPLQYFTERLTGGIVKVSFPAAVSSDPAYWRPTSEDVAALQKADLILLNGATYEQWLKNVSLPTSRIVETANSFRDRWIPLEGAVTHSHGLEGEHEHAGIALTTWLDMDLAADQARAIRDALKARWPDHGSLFDDNFAALEADLMALDFEFRNAAREIGSHSVVFSHPVYQYFQKRYDITGPSLHWEPDEVATDDEWEELKATARRIKATMMIWEAEPDEPVTRRLGEMGLRTAVLDPCSNTPANGDFFTVMRKNVQALRQLAGADGEESMPIH